MRENKKFVTLKKGKEQVSVAAILLFGKNPQLFFPRAYIRFIRYDGTVAKVGKDMNVIKDKTFEGRILEQVEKAVEFIKDQMKEKTYLGRDGIFVTEEEYREFVRTEIVVNAATHRDYSIRGTDIQIKMFDDRLEVDSPGTFAGMVKRENIRYTHFSRNPKIAAFLRDYGYVKEYGEGVDRMCKEMEALGLPAPVFNNSTFILKTTVMSAVYQKLPIETAKVADSNEKWPIETAKVADSNEKWPIGAAKVADSGKTANIGNIGMPMKISIEAFTQAYQGKGYNESTIQNLMAVYEQMEARQVFNSAYLMKVLECSERAARRLLAKLREMNVVILVTGKGKGMYRFKDAKE